MEAIFRWFLIALDPFISRCSKLGTKQLKSLSKDDIALILPPLIETGKSVISEEEEGETDFSFSTVQRIEDSPDEDRDFWL